jgi:hypothetical protein
LARQNRDSAETLLLLTSHAGLESNFDESGVAGVYDSIGRIAAARRAAGLRVHVYVPDNAARSSGDFPSIEGEITPRALREALGAVENDVCSPGRFDYVLIVGSGEIVPYWYLENPAADSDREFPTDVPYAAAAGGGEKAAGDEDAVDDFLLPDRAVARIPLGAAPAGGLLAYLEAAASGEWKGPGRNAHFGLSALEWKMESTRVYGALAAGGLRTSPPVDISTFEPEWLEREAMIYFNVHGSREEKYWYGQDGLSYPRVLSPETVAEAAPANAIVLSEACYGGLVDGKTPEDSVAMGFLSVGVAAFIGSSAIAYGSPDERLTEADLLAYFFFTRLVAGETAGRALREAKVDFAAEMLNRQGYLDGDDRKTLLEFNLFGDPTVGIYKGRGSEDRSPDMVSEEVLASIVKIARERFPELEGVRPDVSEQAGASGEAVAKKIGMLRPSSAAKGGPRPEGRVFIATFRQTITVEGRDIERVVRITFSESGRVVKVVSSK